MPLVLPPSLGHGGQAETNLTAASRVGTIVTASATSHVKGAWVSLIDPTSRPSYGVWVRASTVGAATTITGQLLDIGYGPTGGGSEQVLIPNLATGMAASTGSAAGFGKAWWFPVYIPAGVRVSARVQALIVSDTVLVEIFLHQFSLYPVSAGPVEPYGADTANSRGTSVTTGNGVFGAWAQLTASTLRPHRFWASAYDQLGDVSVANSESLLQLGTGPNASNVSIINQTVLSQGSAELVSAVFHLSYAPVPAGKPIFARIASGEAEARGVIAYGVD
jgi:hypothetical protein